jgi:hypothetical protein
LTKQFQRRRFLEIDQSKIIIASISKEQSLFFNLNISSKSLNTQLINFPYILKDKDQRILEETYVLGSKVIVNY